MDRERGETNRFHGFRAEVFRGGESYLHETGCEIVPFRSMSRVMDLVKKKNIQIILKKIPSNYFVRAFGLFRAVLLRLSKLFLRVLEYWRCL